MGQLTPPAVVDDFKAQFVRDFKYGKGLDSVMDRDIQSGLNLASAMFNADLFDTTVVGGTSEAKLAYLYLTAHLMVTNLQAAGGLGAVGLGVNSQGEGLITSKSAGGVSISLQFPEFVTKEPQLYQFTKTTYGQMYLQILTPKLVGNVGLVLGDTVQSENQLNG